MRLTGVGAYSVIGSVGPTPTAVIVTGLANGQSYQFYVTAVSADGVESSRSNTSASTPNAGIRSCGAPGTPTMSYSPGGAV
jgi:hypothetical protein